MVAPRKCILQSRVPGRVSLRSELLANSTRQAFPGLICQRCGAALCQQCSVESNCLNTLLDSMLSDGSVTLGELTRYTVSIYMLCCYELRRYKAIEFGHNMVN